MVGYLRSVEPADFLLMVAPIPFPLREGLVLLDKILTICSDRFSLSSRKIECKSKSIGPLHCPR